MSLWALCNNVCTLNNQTMVTGIRRWRGRWRDTGTPPARRRRGYSRPYRAARPSCTKSCYVLFGFFLATSLLCERFFGVGASSG